MERTHTVKKSVTIDADVLGALTSARTTNLSATVNESLRLVAALDRQQSLIESWEAAQGHAYTDEELKPYVELILSAEARNRARVARGTAPTTKAG